MDYYRSLWENYFIILNDREVCFFNIVVVNSFPHKKLNSV